MTWQTGSAHSDIWIVRLKLMTVCGRCSKWPPGRRCRSASARRGEDVCSCKPRTETHTTPSTFQQLRPEEKPLYSHPPSRTVHHILHDRGVDDRKIFIEKQKCVTIPNTSPRCHFFLSRFFSFSPANPFLFSARKTD